MTLYGVVRPRRCFEATEAAEVVGLPTIHTGCDDSQPQRLAHDQSARRRRLPEACQLGIGFRLLVSLYDGFQRLHGGRPFPIGEGKIGRGQPTPTGTLERSPATGSRSRQRTKSGPP